MLCECLTDRPTGCVILPVCQVLRPQVCTSGIDARFLLIYYRRLCLEVRLSEDYFVVPARNRAL